MPLNKPVMAWVRAAGRNRSWRWSRYWAQTGERFRISEIFSPTCRSKHALFSASTISARAAGELATPESTQIRQLSSEFHLYQHTWQVTAKNLEQIVDHLRGQHLRCQIAVVSSHQALQCMRRFVHQRCKNSGFRKIQSAAGLGSLTRLILHRRHDAFDAVDPR